MDGDRFDALTERLHRARTRRTALVGMAALGAAALPGVAGAKRCRPGKRRCNGRCIIKEACCTDSECSPPTDACIDGACVEPPA